MHGATLRIAPPLLLAAAALALFGSNAQAVLVHKYNFNFGTAEDLVGNADGTLAGTAEISPFGRLLLSGGEPRNSYLKLPDGIMSAAASGGTAGTFSFEMWVRANTNTNWSAIASFGGAAGRDETYDGGAKDYVQLIAQNGSTNRMRVTTHAINNNTERFVDAGSVLSTISDQHVAVVVDQTGRQPGYMRMYVNGSLAGETVIATGLNFSTMLDNDNWLGRSQHRDFSFDGSFDEFRVYNHALTAAEVTTSFNIGPDAPPATPSTPYLVVDRSSGSLTLRGGTAATQLVGYSISSAFGALLPAGWQPIAGRLDDSSTGNRSFDTDNAWTIISPTGQSKQYTEFELEGGNGGLLAAGAQLRIGRGGAWVRSPVEDLLASIKLDNGDEIELPILYSGNGDQPFLRSDLNFDGVVSPLDWPRFRDYFRIELGNLSLPQAYGRGDLDGDGDNDYDDFLIFQEDFELHNGSGSFAQMLSTPVPEPSSFVLLTMLVGAIVMARRHSSRRWFAAAGAVGVSTMALLNATECQAVLVHQYTFNQRDARDSVGTAHGTVVDPGEATAVFTAAGVLDLSANTGQQSSSITNDAYVDLPNGIVSALGNVGSFEMWVTVKENRNWAEIFSFGAPTTGIENTSTGGSGKGYITLIPDTGNIVNTMSVHHQIPAGAQYELNAPNGQILTPGEEHHIVSVVNKLDTSMGPGGTASLFLNGQLVNKGALPTAFSLGALTDVNNWLGRSQWGTDPLFDGSYNEFRIYDHGLTQQEVTANFQAGPTMAGELTLYVNTMTGEASIRNESLTPVTFNYYEVESATGALSPLNWSSLSDQEQDSTGTGFGQSWNEGGAPSSQLLTELYLTSATQLLPGEQLPLGRPFDPAVLGEGIDGDLQFSYARPRTAKVQSSVVYFSNPVLPGDFNDDGTVDLADYTVWRDHLGSSEPLANDGELGGPVGEAHYALWKEHFGDSISTPGSVAAHQVPETAGWFSGFMVLAIMGSWGQARRARSRRYPRQ
ncbi:LamG domain-containing protein [Aeoliella sp. SH292]|uniref:LamG domain-containing protein n=1 Tax=Aeoliella sp. SH292 TaxID=3454464 RepID=UPI003F9AC529